MYEVEAVRRGRREDVVVKSDGKFGTARPVDEASRNYLVPIGIAECGVLRLKSSRL